MIVEIFLLFSQTILLLGIVYFIFEEKKKDRLQETETLVTFNQTISNVLSFIVDENKKLYETIEKIQVKYFDSLEKNLQRSNQLLEKSDKEFLKVFAEVFKKDVQVESPRVIEADKVENSIENASEPEEILLTDTPRIPIVEGVKVKFEDEEEVYPMNINPIENFNNDKNENPIEK